jgi:hypothetical protein
LHEELARRHGHRRRHPGALPPVRPPGRSGSKDRRMHRGAGSHRTATARRGAPLVAVGERNGRWRRARGGALYLAHRPGADMYTRPPMREKVLHPGLAHSISARGARRGGSASSTAQAEGWWRSWELQGNKVIAMAPAGGRAASARPPSSTTARGEAVVVWGATWRRRLEKDTRELWVHPLATRRSPPASCTPAPTARSRRRRARLLRARRRCIPISLEPPAAAPSRAARFRLVAKV